MYCIHLTHIRTLTLPSSTWAIHTKHKLKSLVVVLVTLIPSVLLLSFSPFNRASDQLTYVVVLSYVLFSIVACFVKKATSARKKKDKRRAKEKKSEKRNLDLSSLSVVNVWIHEWKIRRIQSMTDDCSKHTLIDASIFISKHENTSK